MTTYHERMLTQTEPLEGREIAELREWLAVLKEDVELFGDTPEDSARIAKIEARIARPAAAVAPGEELP